MLHCYLKLYFSKQTNIHLTLFINICFTISNTFPKINAFSFQIICFISLHRSDSNTNMHKDDKNNYYSNFIVNTY